jgi:hypothetical protein
MPLKRPRPATPDERRQTRAREKATIVRGFNALAAFVRSLEPMGVGTYRSTLGAAARAAAIEAMLPAEQWIRTRWNQEEDAGE